ncbi:helicase [Sphingomonas sp. DBB INV C78]|uniref:helicase-related protein n=1 Tax=Sphingomonas sp. DBB INV C78 TaxID=3349434 RepID=UPI0036D21078
MPKRNSVRTGSELFIVDNRDEDWKAQRYLHDWCGLSKGIDVATAYWEIGSLLALDEEWQKVDAIRILMGDEVSRRTKNAFQRAVSERVTRLNDSLEAEKEKNDFLSGVPAIAESLRTGKIRARVYRKAKFHAKAYITHARQEVIGSAALVGSSNFTRPGLTQNIELNVQITGQPVSVLQEWYEEHWEEAEDVTPEMLRTVERHIQEFTPFDIYARSLLEYFAHKELSAGEWEKQQSMIWPLLDGYQREGYGALMKIARRYGGAFLCDGVGLGKTFVGLMVLERLVQHERKKVLLLVPKSARESVWIANLRKYLPRLADGVFSNLKIMNHTDLSRDKLSEELQQVADQADAIIIDEAHNFRNPGVAGEGQRSESRYRTLQRIAQGKEMYLLTATPVNNSILDLMHLIGLFAGDGEKLKRAPLGIHSLKGHFRSLEKKIRQASGEASSDAQGDLFAVDEDVMSGEAHEVFALDPIVSELVVQRSRAYVKASQLKETKGAAVFPVRDDPIVANYKSSTLQSTLLELVEDAFARSRPLLSLAIYNPDDFPKGVGDETVSDFDRGRRRQVVRLIRVGLLKKLESSTVAFDHSCQRLFTKLLTFAEAHVETPEEKRRLEREKHRHEDIIEFIAARQAAWRDEEREEGDDLVTPEMLLSVDRLDRDQYDVEAILDETYNDLIQLARFIHELRAFTPDQDGKLKALITLLKTDPVLKEHKVLIFTEYMTTARFLRDQLREAGVEGVEEVDSATKIDRGEVIKRFAPYYNGSSSQELADRKAPETRVLISTDVLSEGLNLQDATRLINYDLHWNPVRLMQRIGRVDRRMNPAIEAKLVKDHPEVAKLRGRVAYWNFLPPGDVDRLLNLYNRVAGKALRISKLFGIEGRKLLTASDDYDDLRDLNQAMEGEETAEERLRNELRDLLLSDPALDARLVSLPNRIFSGRERLVGAPKGIFFCWSLPGRRPDPDPEAEEAENWTDADGRVAWYYLDLATSQIGESAAQISDMIRSTPETQRRLDTSRDTLRQARETIERHIGNTYLRQVQAPAGVKPILKAWMELN